MGIEIERKFLLASDAWREAITRSQHMRQGYLVDAAALDDGLAKCSVRVRIAGKKAWLNIKSAQRGVERAEFEYPIPLEDAEKMLDTLVNGQVEKTRHLVRVDAHTFEIDEFSGRNQGLILAELELNTADERFPRPDWLGPEVSHLGRYYNVHLIAHPYACWTARERQGEEDS